MSVRKRSAGRRATPERIDTIVDCATTLAATDGLASVTMKSVATATGYVRPVVYDCFADRDALLATVVAGAASSIRRRLAVAESATQAPAGLADGMMAFVDVLLDDPRSWRLFLQSTTGADDETAAIFAAVRAELRASIGRWLARSWPYECDIDAVSVSLLGAIDVLGLLVADQPQTYSRDRLRSMLATIAANSVVV